MPGHVLHGLYHRDLLRAVIGNSSAGWAETNTQPLPPGHVNARSVLYPNLNELFLLSKRLGQRCAQSMGVCGERVQDPVARTLLRELSIHDLLDIGHSTGAKPAHVYPRLLKHSVPLWLVGHLSSLSRKHNSFVCHIILGSKQRVN
jgi:hypothetical protein